MTNLFCVRAEFGTYTKHFVDGGFVAIAWMPNTDLSVVWFRNEVRGCPRMIATGIPTHCRDRHAQITPTHESRHQLRHDVAITP